MPLLPALVGQPAAAPGGGGGTGAAGLLSRADWPVRQAAADMLRAVALLLGPLVELEGSWALSDARCLTGRAMRALEACRFDKVGGEGDRAGPGRSGMVLLARGLSHAVLAGT